MATIIIPDSLGKFTNQETRVLLDGSTIKEVINNLNSKFPELKDKILDKNGAINSNVTIFIENENINTLQKENTPLNYNSNVIINLSAESLEVGTTQNAIREVKEITVSEFEEWINKEDDIQIIDVREPLEYEQINIKALLIPLATIEERAHEIERNKKVVIHCRSGKRSAKAIIELEDKFGFDNLYNLQGGILAIEQETELLSKLQ